MEANASHAHVNYKQTENNDYSISLHCLSIIHVGIYVKMLWVLNAPC